MLMMSLDGGRRDHSTEAAKAAPAGIDKSTIEVGDIVMVGPSRATGDRSYIEAIWRVVGVSANAIAVVHEHGGWHNDDKIVTIPLYEREVYSASDFLAAVRSEEKAQNDRKAEEQRLHDEKLLRELQEG